MSWKRFSPCSWAVVKPSFSFSEGWQFVWGEGCEPNSHVFFHWDNWEFMSKKLVCVYLGGWGNKSKLKCEEPRQQFLFSSRKTESVCSCFLPGPCKNISPLWPCLPSESRWLGNKSSWLSFNYRDCYGLNCVPSKFTCWSANPLAAWNVTLFGARVFREVIEIKWDHEGAS